MTKTGWTVFGTVAFNLALFIVVTSLPAFTELHHHWIFPVLGALFSAQWALDLVILGGAAALLPLWSSPPVTALLLAVGPALLMRRLPGERGIVFFGLALALGGLWFAGRAGRKP